MFTNFVWGIVLLIVGLVIIFTRRRGSNSGYAVLVVSAILIVTSFIRIVPAGTVGVVDLFGKVSSVERKAGLNFINPFARLVIFNVKTEEIKEIMNVPSEEGLAINVDISILYRVSPESASEIYTTVGNYYRDIVIIPLFRSVARGATVSYGAKALYTSGREEIAQKISTDLSNLLSAKGVVLEQVLLRSIQLPPTVSHAIEMKLKAEQEAEQMKFVLEKEKKEAERRIIEAEGISKAQQIINQTLSAAYLQHEAIQAQMKMADSPNHTTVYIPSGDNGIPLIRGLEDSFDKKK